MRYGELFAGAGGLSLGLDRAGMECAFHAEIDEFPRKILKARWPNVPLYGDVAELVGADLVRECGAIDVLSGGSPCQGLSIAGEGAGLSDVRSNLFFHQVRLWRETEAEICLWENVPGALSSNKGQDFAVILSTFAGAPVTVPTKSGRWPRAGYASGPNGVAAWRVLDAQFFGVPQRRRRVFVIAIRAGGADPGQILFELESLRRYSAQSRGQGETAAAGSRKGDASPRVYDARGNGNNEVASTLAGEHQNRVTDYTVLAFHPTQNPIHGEVAPAMGRESGPMGVVTFNPSHLTYGKNGGPTEIVPIIGTLNGTQRQQVDGAMTATMGVPRRLMPVECERLMSWPDNHTRPDNTTPCPDTPRYKACGNGVVSNVVQWIGERIIATCARN